MVKPMEDAASARAFWDWLSRDGERIKSGLARDQQEIREEIHQAFERAFPQLVWEIAVTEDGPWTFCISADGDREKFPLVERAAAEAPDLPGWHIQAFRPRGDLDCTICMDDKELSCDDVWCAVQPSDHGLNLCLQIKGLDEDNAEMLIGAAFILLDNAVGEYDAVMRIGDVEIDVLPDEPIPHPLYFPLHELPAYLDRAAPSAGN